MPWSAEIKVDGQSGIWIGSTNAGAKGLGNHNYCRNPDSDPGGNWCYTSTPSSPSGARWEYCDVGQQSSACDGTTFPRISNHALGHLTLPPTCRRRLQLPARPKLASCIGDGGGMGSHRSLAGRGQLLSGPPANFSRPNTSAPSTRLLSSSKSAARQQSGRLTCFPSSRGWPFHVDDKPPPRMRVASRSLHGFFLCVLAQCLGA